MRKKLVALLLCTVLCLGLWVPALGAYNGGVTVSAALDQAVLDYDADRDQTVTLTVTLSETVGLYSVYFEADLPGELTLAAIDSDIPLTPRDYSLTRRFVSWFDGENCSVKNLAVLTVTVPAGTAAGSYRIGVKEIELATAGENSGNNWLEGGSACAVLAVKNAGSNECIVRFDANGGGGTMAAMTVGRGEAYTLPENGFTAPEGKEYKAWSIGVKEYSPNDVYCVSDDTVVVALWKDAAGEQETVAAPILPKECRFRGTKTIKITCETEGAEIYCTTDGSKPGADGKRYTGPFTISATTTIKAIAVKEGMKDSDIASATYTWEAGEEDDDEEDGTIRVTMRLIGAKLAEKDVDLGAEAYLPAYVTWIPTTRYTLEEGATVYDLFVKATESAGIRSVGAENNYVETIFAPDSLGGYELSEFTNGNRSGWMYTVNGKHPGLGLRYWPLKDGDVVIWHYVNDYSYEVDDWFSEDGKWPALGDGTYYNRWLKAPDRFGVSGGGVGEGAQDNEDSGSGSSSELTPSYDGDTVWLPAEVDRSEGGAALNAEAVLNKTIAAEGLEKAEDKSVLKLWVEIEDANGLLLKIEPDAVQELADAGAGLRMECSRGVIEIDAEAVSGLTESGKEVRIAISYSDWFDKTRISVTVNHEAADIRMKIELPATDGSLALAIVNSDSTRTVIRKSAVVDDRIYAEISGSATVQCVGSTGYLDDVKSGDWFSSAVRFVMSHELMTGVDKFEFAPDAPMTRAMLVTVLYRLEDAPELAGSPEPFGDVDAGSWYAAAVAWAAGTGLVNGTDRGFEPNANISREQIAAILYRYMKYLGFDVSAKGDLSRFEDGKDVSSWAQDAMAWAVGVGLFRGDENGCLDPRSNSTRAEVATLLMRLIRLIVVS